MDVKIIGGCDCDLGHSKDRSYATLGWIINKAYRNRGYAGETVVLLGKNITRSKSHVNLELDVEDYYRIKDSKKGVEGNE